MFYFSDYGTISIILRSFEYCPSTVFDVSFTVVTFNTFNIAHLNFKRRKIQNSVTNISMEIFIWKLKQTTYSLRDKLSRLLPSMLLWLRIICQRNVNVINDDCLNFWSAKCSNLYLFVVANVIQILFYASHGGGQKKYYIVVRNRRF